MRRAYVEPQPLVIVPFWCLFEWRRCAQCGMEFRRESGWQVWLEPRSTHFKALSARQVAGQCYCKECFATADELAARVLPRLGNVDAFLADLRAAGGDAWDNIDDPEAFLGRTPS